jgi:hypothetical protein
MSICFSLCYKKFWVNTHCRCVVHALPPAHTRSLYEVLHLNFTSALPSKLLEALAAGTVRANAVPRVAKVRVRPGPDCGFMDSSSGSLPHLSG